MKKLLNLKEITIILMSVALIAMSTTVFATSDLVLSDNNQTTITGNEYDNAQTPTTTDTTVNNSVSENNTVNESANNTNTENKAKTYETIDNEEEKDTMPKTGIEDYNVGILLVVCVASAIFAYKKINDYKNI